MNAFKVTYTDGTHYTTNANGTATEFEAYLTQAGRTICTYENPETGAETFKTIEKVQQVPQVGEVYEFQDFENVTCKSIVTHVTDTHVYYKFGDVVNENDSLLYHRSYPMTLDVWMNKDKHTHTGNTTDPEALEFFV